MIGDINRLEIAGKNRPKYARICREIENGIASGHYSGQLPGVTLLARHYQVNPLTVSKALECLSDQGIVEIIPRVGTFVKNKNRIAILALYSKEDFQRCNCDHSFPSQPVMSTMLEGVNEYLNRRRYALLAHAVSVDDHEFIRFILNEVDGVLVFSGRGVNDQDYEIFSSVPWVKLMGGADSPSQAHHITYDNIIIGEIAADYLLQQPCDHYYYFGGRQHVFAQRFQSFSDRLAAVGKKAEIIELDIAVMELDELMQQAQIAFEKLLSNGSAGIFLSSSSYAVPVYQLLYSMGITPVNDLPLITCENIAGMLQGVIPKPAVIDLRIREIGRRGCELLMGIIKKTSTTGTFDKIVYTPQMIGEHHPHFKLKRTDI